jgi:hypothetical protein
VIIFTENLLFCMLHLIGVFMCLYVLDRVIGSGRRYPHFSSVVLVVNLDHVKRITSSLRIEPNFLIEVRASMISTSDVKLQLIFFECVHHT